MSVPDRARLYYVSAHQGQVIGKCPAGPGISAQQGQQRGWCGIPQGNSIHCCSKRPTPVGQYRAQYPTRMRMLAGPLVKP